MGGTLRLAGLGDSELAGLRERVAHVREACTGYRHGSRELAQQGEPRPGYAPGAGKLQRYRAKAAELGVGVRTVRRWAVVGTALLRALPDGRPALTPYGERFARDVTPVLKMLAPP